MYSDGHHGFEILREAKPGIIACSDRTELGIPWEREEGKECYIRPMYLEAVREAIPTSCPTHTVSSSATLPVLSEYFELPSEEEI